MAAATKKAKGDEKRASKVEAFRHLLGVETDAEVGRKAGVVAETVRVYRTRLGIAAAKRGLPPEKTDKAEARPPQRRIVQRREEKAAPKAEEPKVEAKPEKVEKPKKAKAEKAAKAPKAAKADAVRRGGKPSPIDAFADQVGRVPDAEIALKAGVTRAAVYQYRRYRNIAKKEEAAPAAAAPVAPAAPAAPVAPVARKPAPVARAAAAPAKKKPVGYIVTIKRDSGEHPYVVVGADIAEAATVAVRAAGSGEVVSIVRHLEALG